MIESPQNKNLMKGMYTCRSISAHCRQEDEETNILNVLLASSKYLSGVNNLYSEFLGWE